MNRKETIRSIGQTAYAALRLEAWTTPKPGLVDRENSGAHTDMDYPLFLTSCEALEAYFTDCAVLGAGSAGCFAEYAQKLRNAGLRAEKSMFQATGGVNTHKGAVFSLGILCACLGHLSAQTSQPPNQIDPAVLRVHCSRLASELLHTEAKSDTHGRRVYEKDGIGGIRREALSGFSTAFLTGWPAILSAREKGLALNAALVKALLRLMCRTEDSNAVHRGGPEGLAYIRETAQQLLQTADLRTAAGMESVRQFDRECTRRNLSPGGCADLLALSVMLYLIYKN